MDSVIEIFRNGAWIPAATLQTFGPEACRLEYRTEYIFGDDPLPIALGLPVEFQADTLSDEPGAYDRRPPSFLYDLVPQGQGRRFLLKTLHLADSDQLVLPLICAGAFNPIGNLRFSTAVDFYREQARANPPPPEFGSLTLDDIRNRSGAFLDHISLHGMLASGTTGVQGVAPKYLLAQDADDRWYADLALDDAQARKHWLVKLPRGTADEDRSVLRNEAAYLRVARACGLRVHEEPLLIGNMLFVRRFDRHVDGAGLHRLHQESLASLAGLRGFAPASSQNEILAALRQHASDPASETLEFVKRDVLNLALRNTDNHARNSAVQRTVDGQIQLTPVYDFAPMFMDPEIVPRSLHWRDKSNVRLDTWERILGELDVPASERLWLAGELHEFGHALAQLLAIARDCGIEAYVLEQCRLAIDQQLDQLSRLSPHPAQPDRARHG